MKDIIKFSAALAAVILMPSLAAGNTLCDFSAFPTSETVPLTVAFSDINTGSHSNWIWNFGDGTSLPAPEPWHPVHTYNTAGTYTVTLSVSDGVTWASNSTSINVLKATPTITWNNPADITYGTALGGTQLNAVVTDPTTGAPVSGQFVYTPASGTILNLGSQILHVDFTPIDTVNYYTASKDVTINIISCRSSHYSYASLPYYHLE